MERDMIGFPPISFKYPLNLNGSQEIRSSFPPTSFKYSLKQSVQLLRVFSTYFI